MVGRCRWRLACVLWVSVLTPMPAHGSWWLESIGVDERSPGQSVIVAVIDSGLDFAHPDIDPSRIWRHGTELPNGKDDDGNGYIDDLIGWDFVDNDNNPWDTLGHGTFVTGLIAATVDNGVGIDGVTNNVLIMPLRTLNSAGYGTPDAMARAFLYAIESGAQVINLSLGQNGVLGVEKALLRYADERGVVVVVAAGNLGIDVAGFGPAGSASRQTLVVGSVGRSGERSTFSNRGAGLTLTAPGVDLESLRARRTDFNRVLRVPSYEAGDGFSGTANQSYRAEGTSFSAPIVAGVVAEVWAQRPALSAAEVVRVVTQSALDLDLPGRDWRTGFGLVNLAAALTADEDRYILAEIDRVEVVTEGGRPAISVIGEAAADRFKSGELEIAKAGSQRWRRVAKVSASDGEGALGFIAASEFAGSPEWQIRLTVRHRDGGERVNLFELRLN